MRYAAKYSIAATLVAGAAATGHQHQQFHAKKSGASPVEKREADRATEWVVAPTATVFNLGGELIDEEHARQGIKDGQYIVVGESTPEFVPPPPPAPAPAASSEPAPEPATSSAAADMGAQFVESESKTEEVQILAEPTPTVESSSSAPAPSSTSSAASEPSEDASPAQPPTTGGGLDTPFPDGQVKCSKFPSSFGAVYLDWLGFNGWSGLQRVPDYSAFSSSIVEIHTGISGDDCEPGSMCSYACPPGYMSTQWPKAQGSDRESIGGLYCNEDGFLELTREGHDTLCEAGVGGVSIHNKLKDVVSTCQTVYPGTEAMVIPTIAQPGSSVDLCNPPQDEFMWQNKPTSAQYYVNKAGYEVGDACVWNSDRDPEGAGNWAPVNIGVGRAADGNTYLSIFPNAAISDAKLDFNIKITGDIIGECSLIDGVYSGSSNGCTATMPKGGKAVFTYF